MRAAGSSFPPGSGRDRSISLLLLAFQTSVDQQDVRLSQVGMIQAVFAVALVGDLLGAEHVFVALIHKVLTLARPRCQEGALKAMLRLPTCPLTLDVEAAVAILQGGITGVAVHDVNLVRPLSEINDRPPTGHSEAKGFGAQGPRDLPGRDDFLVRLIERFRGRGPFMSHDTTHAIAIVAHVCRNMCGLTWKSTPPAEVCFDSASKSHRSVSTLNG